MTAYDNLEEFQDPLNYDLEFGGDDPGRNFYLELAIKTGGDVLELACGSGLALMPIAQQGISCTGVDISRPMIEHARHKAGDLPLDYQLGDARSVQLEKVFSLIMLTGNAFQAFLTDADQAALLASVRRHLKPDGLFAFETRNPAGTDLTNQDSEEEWHSFTDSNGETVQISGTQQYDEKNQLMHWCTIRRFSDKLTRCRITCRFTTLPMLNSLLADNGFTVVAQYGDWSLSPVIADSPAIISVCGLTPAIGAD